jgi:hypothetical protein
MKTDHLGRAFSSIKIHPQILKETKALPLVDYKDLSTTLNVQQVKYGVKVGSVINGDQCITYLNHCHANSSCDSYVWLDMHQA